MDWLQYIPAIISALAVIVTGWFKYNQSSKDKMADLRIEQLRKALDEKKVRRADNSAIVYGELWAVLAELHADRVYIVQPHPLGNESMVSIFFESKRKGVESMKPKVQRLKMSEVASFCSSMAKQLYMYYDDIDAQVEDRYAKALLSACGTKIVAIKRMSDSTYDWVGSIFVEFTHSSTADPEKIRQALHEAATNIQYLLPAYQGDESSN